MSARPAVQPIPEGFHTVTPYLTVQAATQLLEFLKQGLGAKELFRANRPDGSVAHAQVRIGDSMLELAEGSEQWKPRSAAIHLYVPEVDATYRQAIAAGGASLEEPTDQNYGDREAGVKDPCGNQWWIATHKAAGASKYVPDGLRSITPFLSVRGAAKMVDFLKQAFDAAEESCAKSPDGRVQHAKIRIGDSIVELSDAHGEFQPLSPAIHLYVPDVDAVFKRTIQAGAASLSEPADQFYGERGGGVMDPWGNHWYIATHTEDVSPEELARRMKALGQHA